MSNHLNKFLIEESIIPDPFNIQKGDVYRGIGDMDSEIRLVVTKVRNEGQTEFGTQSYKFDALISWITTDSYETYSSSPDDFRMRLVCSMLTPFGRVKTECTKLANSKPFVT